jgi:hypothetical protein
VLYNNWYILCILCWLAASGFGVGFSAFRLLAYNVGMAEVKSVVEHVQQA